MKEICVRKGGVLYEEGQGMNKCFLINSGTVVVKKKLDTNQLAGVTGDVDAARSEADVELLRRVNENLNCRISIGECKVFKT
jgi:hypothetical protein